MRGAFNKLSDWYYGPSSLAGPPGALIAAAVPCRVVPQTQISQFDWPYKISVAWITMDLFEPHLPEFHSPALWFVGVNWLESDRVALVPGDPADWWVMRKERVAPPLRTPYWRCLIANIGDVVTPPWLPPSPYPVPPPPPVTCAVASSLCSSAGTLLPSMLCVYGFDVSLPLWLVLGDGLGGFVNIMSNVTSGVVFLEIWTGADCASKSFLMTVPAGGTVPIAVAPGQWVFVLMQSGIGFSTVEMSWVP